MGDFAAFLFSFLIIFLASAVQGATAFGFALVSMPFLLLFMPMVEAVTLSLILACFVNLLMIGDERRDIAWREVILLLPGAAAGAVAGMLFLRTFDGPLFESLVAAAFAAMALVTLAGRAWRMGTGHFLRQSAGALSGMLMGATSMGGPPVVLFLAGRGLNRSSLRGTLALFFLIANLFALAAFMGGGLLDRGVMLRSLLLAAALMPGYKLGRRLTLRLDTPAFRKLALLSMAFLAMAEVLINTISEAL